MPREIDDKVALVIGGGTGMGFAAARRLMRRGVRVVLSSRRESVLAAARAQLRQEHPDAAVEIVPGDASLESETRAIVDATLGHYGRLDILVGAAGAYEAVEFVDLDTDSWRRTLATTLDAMLFPAVATAREMRKAGGGRIVLISSIDTIVSEPEVTAYNAAKAAVGGIVRSICVDCTKYGIQANAVAPGWVDTPMAAPYLATLDPGVLAKINPIERVSDPDEIGNVIEYLALDAPPSLTGSTIFVDGGQTIRGAMP